MRHYRKLVISVLLVIVGCATSPEVTNHTPILRYSLTTKPSVTVYADPDVDWSKYKTFSVFPYSLLDTESKLDSIAQKQVLFYIRNLLEDKGYTIVEPNKNPDFLVTVNFMCEYKTHDVPPRLITVPQYIPGKTIRTYQNNYGSVNTYGDMNIWGTYNGGSTSTTYIPGTRTTRTYIEPGYTVGSNYHSALVLIYDGTNPDKKIWYANGTAENSGKDKDDFRIFGQWILYDMLAQFSFCKNVSSDSQEDGFVGIEYIILTLDGNNYFPAILEVCDIPDPVFDFSFSWWGNATPAQRADIRTDDLIISINNESTVNKSYLQIKKMLSGSEGTELHLEIQRGDATKNIKIVKSKRPKGAPNRYD